MYGYKYRKYRRKYQLARMMGQFRSTSPLKSTGIEIIKKAFDSVIIEAKLVDGLVPVDNNRFNRYKKIKDNLENLLDNLFDDDIEYIFSKEIYIKSITNLFQRFVDKGFVNHIGLNLCDMKEYNSEIIYCSDKEHHPHVTIIQKPFIFSKNRHGENLKRMDDREREKNGELFKIFNLYQGGEREERF